MSFPWLSVAGVVVAAFLVFKHHEWIELAVGRRVASWLAIAAALVVALAGSYRPADFSQGFSWVVQQAVEEVRPWMDDLMRSVTPQVTTSTTTAPPRTTIASR